VLAALPAPEGIRCRLRDRDLAKIQAFHGVLTAMPPGLWLCLVGDGVMGHTSPIPSSGNGAMLSLTPRLKTSRLNDELMKVSAAGDSPFYIAP